MAEQAQEKTFRYRHYRLFRNAILGTGAYGQVCRAKLDELPCAAKLLHPILVDRSDPKNQTNLRKFEQECRFLSEIRHPNIVQYLGMVYDRETGLPVLLMELMDESLTHFLERSDTPLPYHVQVDISHDIALALAYLHSNDIIHRDLSSNNVLLIRPGYRAKVTDFGMSKFTEMHPHLTPLTKCPGTQAYMAPEALQEETLYTAKLDVFQAGVLMVQIITRKFPDPTRANQKVNFPQSPTGIIWMPVPELERRHNHLSLISDTHSMVGLIRDCLKDEEKDRPTTQQLCQQLSTLKEATRYSESFRDRREDGIENSDREGGEGGMREACLRGREGEIERRERDVEQRLEEVGIQETQIEARERDIERRETQIGQRQTEIEQREREVEQELRQEREGKIQLERRLRQQMQDIQLRYETKELLEAKKQSSIRADIDAILEEKDNRIEKLEQELACTQANNVVELTSECEDFKQQIRIKDSQVDDLQRLTSARGYELEQVAAKVESYEQQNAELNAACAELRASLEQCREEMSQQQQQQHLKKEGLPTKVEPKAAGERVEGSSEQKIREMEREQEEMIQNCQAASEQLSVRQRECDQQRDRIVQLEAEVTGLTQRYEEMVDRHDKKIIEKNEELQQQKLVFDEKAAELATAIETRDKLTDKVVHLMDKTQKMQKIKGKGEEDSRNCPVCHMKFPLRMSQQEYERHVQSHFEQL